MKFWAKMRCKKDGHQWSSEWHRDESRDAKEWKKRGYDRFLNPCLNGCGENRDITQQEEVTQMYGLIVP